LYYHVFTYHRYDNDIYGNVNNYDNKRTPGIQAYFADIFTFNVNVMRSLKLTFIYNIKQLTLQAGAWGRGREEQFVTVTSLK
jgi:hypothetical protein